MKAIVYDKYGSPDVLQLREVEKPTPKEGEALVKIHATSINKGDWYALTGKPFLVRLTDGLFKPKNKILGMEAAGRIEAIGRDVKEFQSGDEVYGDISWCGKGGFAEYVSVPEKLLSFKPANLSFEESATVPVAAIAALQGIRDIGEIKPGQKVLINGGSGGVGTFAVQIAKSYETEVTAVCSMRSLEMARSFADHVIDYTQEDFTQKGQLYDLIIGVNGHNSLTDIKRALSPKGTYVCIGGPISHIFQSNALGPLMSKKEGKQIKGLVSVKQGQKDLVVMKELIEADKIAPVIDRRYTLSETAEAFRYFGGGHAKGKVVITVVEDSEQQAAF